MLLLLAAVLLGAVPSASAAAQNPSSSSSPPLIVCSAADGILAAFESHKLPEFTYPRGLLLRRVNNSGDISWHKNRVFISEVFSFEELGFELITPGFCRVFFRDMGIGELNAEEFRFRAAR
jgi:hypothetical protein